MKKNMVMSVGEPPGGFPTGQFGQVANWSVSPIGVDKLTEKEFAD